MTTSPTLPLSLLIAEHDGQTISSATLNTLTAALQLGNPVHMLIMGKDCQAAANAAASLPGVSQVWLATAPHLAEGLAENLTQQALTIAARYSHILLAASTLGKNIAPRLAAKLDVSQISDITRVIDSNTFERPIYAGNAIATVQTDDAIKVITVRPTAFAAPAAHQSPNEASSPATTAITAIDIAPDTQLSHFIHRTAEVLDRPDLGSAKIVISGGRGLGSGENFKTLLEPLAKKLNAAIGASRAAVDAGYVMNDYQVGQTGKIVAPELYIAIGISGAIQHLAGMKDSRVIVAINKDPNAPIFSIASYGLVGDLFSIVPELMELL